VSLVVDGGAPVTVPTAADGTWTYTPVAPLGDGPHTAVATAADSDGNTATDTTTFTVDATAPAVAITTPADGSSTRDTTPAIAGTSDVVSGTISLAIDGGAPVAVPTDGTGAWTHIPATPLAEGPHTVVVTATDAAGNSASDSSTFTVDTVAPAVDITSPEDGSTTQDNTPPISGTSDVLSGTIQLVVDGQPPVTVGTDATGAWTWTPVTPLPNGPHTATATATDAAGNTATDETTFTVTAPAAEVVITAPEDGSSTTDTTPDVTGTTNPGATVDVLLDGRPAVPVRADDRGRWTMPTGPLACGRHTVTARVGTLTDGASDRSTFTVACAAVGLGAPVAAGTLPRTGSNAATMAGLGLLMSAAGALALRTARRRRWA
jgi:LPXTG-motif cell wall-anchored protein